MKDKIINWIKKQVRLAGAKGIVIGLSGGIDSSVAAALARGAIGKERILGLILPCHSQRKDLEDARFIARKLGINSKTVDLSGLYDQLIGILPQGGSIARANIKPRLRMLVLYYFANRLNYLVCGTGNKSELMMGYFTKYGDGGTDILPIGDLLKREVKGLAGELEIPARIISKPPSAGLWSGQTDEAEMGITYYELDEILARMEAGRRQVAGSEKINKVKMALKGSRHKRECPKICYIKRRY